MYANAGPEPVSRELPTLLRLANVVMGLMQTLANVQLGLITPPESLAPVSTHTEFAHANTATLAMETTTPHIKNGPVARWWTLLVLGLIPRKSFAWICHSRQAALSSESHTHTTMVAWLQGVPCWTLTRSGLHTLMPRLGVRNWWAFLRLLAIWLDSSAYEGHRTGWLQLYPRHHCESILEYHRYSIEWR